MAVEAINLTFIHYDNAVCIFYRGNSLRDDQLCRIGNLFSESLSNLSICCSIYRTGRIIENQHLRLLQKGSCDAETLALATGYIGTSLFDMSIISIGEFLDEFIRTGKFCCMADFFITCIRVTPAKILRNRT